MKKILFFICLILQFMSCSEDKDHEDYKGGGKYFQFMNTLDALIPMQGGTVEFTAENNSIFVNHISAISNNDTIKETFDLIKDQIIRRDWYSLKVRTYEQLNRSKGGLLDITVEPNSDNLERKLIISVTNANISNIIEIEQK